MGEQRRRKKDRKRLSELLDGGYKTRRKAVALAKMLVADGVLSATAIEGLQGGNGHLALSSDLFDLAELFETNFSDLDVGGLLTERDIQNMKCLAGRLFSAPSKRRLPVQEPSLEEIVAKAYALLKQFYKKLRRGMLFLLEDAKKVDAFIPPFVNQRSKRSAGAPAVDGAQTPEATPTGDADARVGEVSAATRVASSSEVQPAADAAPVATAVVDSGSAPPPQSRLESTSPGKRRTKPSALDAPVVDAVDGAATDALRDGHIRKTIVDLDLADISGLQPARFAGERA